jgi:hypothetical protein
MAPSCPTISAATAENGGSTIAAAEATTSGVWLGGWVDSIQTKSSVSATHQQGRLATLCSFEVDLCAVSLRTDHTKP